MSDIYLLGATYPDVPAVDLPKSGGGTARFVEAEDGDELEYGSAGLAGTTWYFDTAPTMPSSDATYSVNFTSNSASWTSMELSSFGSISYVNGVDIANAYASFFGGWQNAAYRTVAFTGGTDATNADLIAWIQANATQQ